MDEFTLAIGFALGAVGYHLVRWFISRRRDPAFTTAVAALDGEVGRAVEMMQDLLSERGRILEEKASVERKAKEYLAKIEEVIAERETWRELYNDQAGGHENAQALMMRTITGLARAYHLETGKTFQLDPLISMVSEDWYGKHGKKARNERAGDGRETDSEEKPA